MPDKKENKGNNGNNGGQKPNCTQTNDGKSDTNTGNVPTIFPYMAPQHGFFPPFGMPGQISPNMYRPAVTPYPTQQDNSQDKLIELFQEMNSRLKSIEQTVNKIGPMEKDLAYLKNQISNMHENNTALSKKVTDVEQFCQYNSDKCDDIVSTHEKTHREIDELKYNNNILSAQVQSLLHKNDELNTRCLDIQSKQMENELIIFGVSEARPDETNQREDVKSTLTETLLSKLGELQNQEEVPVSAENFKFEKVYRVGNPVKAKENNRPRPIIVKFENNSDRNIVRRAGMTLNKSKQNVKIYEHFPREIEERRKILYPILRQLSSQGERVSLVKDRLFVNNKPFNINNGSYIDRYGRVCYVSSRNSPAYSAHPVFPATNPAEHCQNPRPIAVNQYQQSRQNFQKPKGRALTFETPNRFELLADQDRTNQKRKERSPLEQELESKRPNVNDSGNGAVDNSG